MKKYNKFAYWKEKIFICVAKIKSDTGIFSDEDINEAERLIKEGFKKPPVKGLSLEAKLTDEEKERIKREFLKGFEEGWKDTKSSEGKWGRRGRYMGELSVGLGMDYLNVDIYREPRKFGIGFGALVGTLKFQPKFIVSRPHITDHFFNYVKFLKQHQPTYYQMIEKRLKRWNQNMKEHLGELSKAEQDRYIWLLKRM